MNKENNKIKFFLIEIYQEYDLIKSYDYKNNLYIHIMAEQLSRFSEPFEMEDYELCNLQEVINKLNNSPERNQNNKIQIIILDNNKLNPDSLYQEFRELMDKENEVKSKAEAIRKKKKETRERNELKRKQKQLEKLQKELKDYESAI